MGFCQKVGNIPFVIILNSYISIKEKRTRDETTDNVFYGEI